jgi:hemerythrin-like domain-containing protein
MFERTWRDPGGPTMRPTEVLMQEHRVIEQVILCLEEIANRCEAGQPFDVDSANEAIDFFRVFADRCHHAKEEDLLFPIMEKTGISRSQGPTGLMLHEHDEGRRHVRAMVEAIRDFSSGRFTAMGAFIDHARYFAELLRQHIFKEDHCVFPMADEALTPVDQSALSESFDQAERGELGPDLREKYIQIADRLSERFGVAKTANRKRWTNRAAARAQP